MRTRAKSNADEMITGKIDDANPLDFRANRADVGRVNEVDDKSEAFKGCVFEEVAIPQLGPSQLKSA